MKDDTMAMTGVQVKVRSGGRTYTTQGPYALVAAPQPDGSLCTIHWAKEPSPDSLMHCAASVLSCVVEELAQRGHSPRETLAGILEIAGTGESRPEPTVSDSELEDVLAEAESALAGAVDGGPTATITLQHPGQEPLTAEGQWVTGAVATDGVVSILGIGHVELDEALTAAALLIDQIAEHLVLEPGHEHEARELALQYVIETYGELESNKLPGS